MSSTDSIYTGIRQMSCNPYKCQTVHILLQHELVFLFLEIVSHGAPAGHKLNISPRMALYSLQC